MIRIGEGEGVEPLQELGSADVDTEFDVAMVILESRVMNKV